MEASRWSHTPTNVIGTRAAGMLRDMHNLMVKFNKAALRVGIPQQTYPYIADVDKTNVDALAMDKKRITKGISDLNDMIVDNKNTELHV